jgi:SpoVK/Ycf46/Vps4 family AAA+-type ATPase
MNEAKDLELTLKSRTPIIVFETHEENRALDLLNRIAVKNGVLLHAWSITEGLRPIGFSIDQNDVAIMEPEEALKVIKNSKAAAIYVLCDFHPFMSADHPKNIRYLKDIALSNQKTNKTVVLLSHSIAIPAELKRFTAHFQMSLPNDEQIMAIIQEEAKAWSDNNKNVRIKTDNLTLERMVHNLKGLSQGDVRLLVRSLISEGAINQEDIPEISKAKFQLLDMEGMLSYEYDTEKFSNVGGLDNLKRWLKERKKSFLHGSVEQDVPKGVLLLGVQGSGKSLAAKAVAGMWGLPLLRMDMAAMYNKYIGESERNLREALKMADMMSPCVLWLDEVEKGLARDNSDTGTSQRILGTLLTWMAERKSKVFIVATSNDISGLPPELIRKGRLDEIFFVDLPDENIRKNIFEIHLKRRNLLVEKFDLDILSQCSAGFSGAEIEQAVVSAVYRANSTAETIGTQHVVEEINKTKPISVVMADQIEELREWAKEKTVSAN